MWSHKGSIITGKIVAALVTIYIFSISLQAQIIIENLRAVSIDSVALTISSLTPDLDASGFIVEVTSDVADGPWSMASSTTVEALPGLFTAVVNSLDLNTPVFFRVRHGDQVSTPAQASFASTDVTVVEGEGQIVLEVILSRSISGILYHRASGNGLRQPVDGSTPVNGSTARITLPLEDNGVADPQRDITVSLIADDQGIYNPDAGNGALTVVILDNDSIWSGVIESTLLDFPVMILSSVSGNSHDVALMARGGELIPEGLYNASSASAPNQPFTAAFRKIRVPSSDENGLFQDVEISMDLTASKAPGLDPLLEGPCRIEIHYPGKPWLNTSASGTFTLTRVVEAPAARQSLLEPNL